MRKVGYACLFLLLASCSAERDPGSDKVGVAEQPLSAGEHCDTAPANAPINLGELAVSPQQYGSSLCSKAHLVDVNWTPGYSMSVTVEWNDARPTNPTDCSNAVLMSYLWQKSGSNYNYLGAETSHGAWIGGACQINPIVDAPLYGNYRYAISARLNNSTRYVDIYSTTLHFDSSGGTGGGP